MMFSMAVAGWTAQFAPGDKVEIYSAKKWVPGVVREAKGDEYKVGFDGYSAVWDAWVTADKLRKSDAPAATGATSVSAPATTFKKGDRVEAKIFGMWFKGTVGEVETARVQVHFDDKTIDWIETKYVKLLAVQAPAGQPDVVTRPSGAKTGIEGAFLRVESFYMGTSLTMANQAWFFTKDGKFSKSPDGGFSFANFPATAANSGTYWISGGKISFAYADGSKPLVYELQNKGDELKWGGLGATRVEGFKKGWRFDGEYEGGASIGGGAMMAANKIVFRRDGTYARESTANFSNANTQSTVSGGAQNATVGTYEFDGFTLTLKPADETEMRFTVFAFGDKDRADRPEYIYRDGTMLKRR